MRKWWLDQLVKQGNCSKICTFTVIIPEDGAVPERCVARFTVDPAWRRPVLSGLIKGAIQYGGRKEGELQFTRAVGFLMDGLPSENEGRLLITAGKITAVVWRPDDQTVQGWQCDALAEFKWYLIKAVVLSGLNTPVPPGAEVIRMMTAQPLARRQLKFYRTVWLNTAPPQVAELKVALKWSKTVWAKKGLLLTALLGVETFYPHPAGVEAYRQWETEVNELVTAERLPAGVGPETGMRATVAAAVVGAANYLGRLRAELAIDCCLNFFQDRLIEAVKDPRSPWVVLASVQTETPVFTVSAVARFVLRERPERIHTVETVLSRLEITPQIGSLRLYGEQEVSVAYSDSSGRQRVDRFQDSWRESMVGNTIDSEATIAHRAKLIYDTFTLEGQNIVYRYWWEVTVTATRLEAVPLALDAVYP
jgi:hypothetical protein